VRVFQFITPSSKGAERAEPVSEPSADSPIDGIVASVGSCAQTLLSKERHTGEPGSVIAEHERAVVVMRDQFCRGGYCLRSRWPALSLLAGGWPWSPAGVPRRPRARDRHAHGRLRVWLGTKEEFDGRVSQTFAARTYGELAVITADIPAGLAPAPPPLGPAPAPVNPAAHASQGGVIARSWRWLGSRGCWSLRPSLAVP